MTPGAESEFYLQQANAQCLFFGYSVVIFAPPYGQTQTVTQTRKNQVELFVQERTPL